MNFSQLFKNFKTSVANHSPEILTGIGIAGMITAGVLAVKETPKALRLIEEKKKELQTDKLTAKETVRTTWKCYVPSVGLTVMSTACLIGSTKVSLRRNAALATAYKLSESALTTYKEKVIETVGEKKEQSIRESIAQDKIDANPVSQNNVIVIGNGTTLCYDSISGRYFKSSKDALQRAENDLNRRMRYSDYISLNEFYAEIGLPSIDIGDDLGWNIERGYIEIFFSSHIADDGTPCLDISFCDRHEPKYGYSKFA